MSTSSPIASSSRLPSSHQTSTPSSSRHASSSTPKQTPKTPRPKSSSSKGKERARDALEGKLPLPLSPATTSTKGKRVRRPNAPSGLSNLNEAGPSYSGDEADLFEGREEWESEGLVEEEGRDVVPTVFSPDGRYFFKAIGTRIHIHSTTGPHHSLITTLPSTTHNIPHDRPYGHSLPITSLTLHPTNPLQLISSSLDGSIILWSWTSSPSTALVKQLDLGFNYEFLCGYKDVRKAMVEHRREMRADGKRWITGMGRGVGKMTVGTEGGKVYVYASLVPRKVKSGSTKLFKDIIVRVPLRQTPLPAPEDSPTLTIKQRARTARANMDVLGHIPTTVSSVSVSPRGTYLLVTSGKDAFVRRLDVAAYIAAGDEDETGRGSTPEHAWSKVSTNTTITTGAWCPVDGLGLPEFMRNRDEEWFATGEHKGLIKLWYGLSEAFEARKVVKGGQSSSSSGDSANRGEDLHKLQSTILTNTTLHWHAHSVSTLVFHPTGTQLFSGGEENVLVSWQLDKLKESFVPRLGSGGIASIGIKPTGPNGAEEEVWVRLRDGTTKKVGTATGLTTSVGKEARLDQVNKVDSRLAYPLGYHLPTGSYVLPSSHPSVIQFYQPSSSSVLFELEVTPSNRVSRRDQAQLEAIRVESVCFSSVGEDGIAHWMATSESREGDAVEGGGKAKAIKLWEWQRGGYTLNTHLTKSHGLSNITSMSFGPVPSRSTKSDAIFLSTSEDGIAKTWHVRKAVVDVADVKDAKKSAPTHTLFWTVRSTFSHRSLPITSSAFSPDHSLIALAHGSVITLWDTFSNALLKVLECGSGAAGKVAFVGGAEGGRWLAVVGKDRGVGVWDLMSGEGESDGVEFRVQFETRDVITPYSYAIFYSVAWTLPSFPAHALLTSASTSTFTVLSTRTTSGQSPTTYITSFSPTSHQPIISAHVPQRLFSPISATNEILALSSKGVPVRVGPDLKAFAKPIKSLKEEGEEILTGQIEGMSIWEEMFGKGVFSAGVDDVVDEFEADVKPELSSAPEKRGKYSGAFDGASHTLPPTTILFDSFLEDFLKPDREAVVAEERRRARAEHVDGMKMEVDGDEVLMEDEEDVKVSRPERVVAAREVPEEDVRQLGEWFKGLLGDAAPSASIRAHADANVSTPSKIKSVKKTNRKTSNLAEAIATNGNGNGESPKVGQKRKVDGI